MRDLLAENNDIRLKPLQLICIVAILQLLISFLTYPMIFTHEEAMWQYIGRNWIRHGMVPYSGGVDNKSPLIFLVFGISDRLFGVNFWFPRLLGIAVQSAGMYGLYKIAEKMIDRRAGIFAITIYGLSLLWHSTGGKYVSFTETYAISFLIIAVYFGIAFQQQDKYSFIGGFFAGLGFGFRFSAVFGILPVIIFTFRRSRNSAFIFLLGFMSSLCLIVFLMVLAGIKMEEFLFYGFADNFGSGSPTGHSIAWKAQAFADGFFYSELILFYPAIVYYFFLNRKIDFLKTWLISEFIGIVILGIYARNHFKDLLPAMSLMSAFAINHLIANHQAPAKQILLGIWIVFFPKTFEPLLAVKKIFFTRGNQSAHNYGASVEDEDLKKNLGIWIRANTIPGDKVFIAGYGAQVQAYSERVSPSIYFNITQTPPAKKRLFRDLTTHRPEMLVIPLFEKYADFADEDIRLFIDDLAKKNYSLDTSLYNYNIYRPVKLNNP